MKQAPFFVIWLKYEYPARSQVKVATEFKVCVCVYLFVVCACVCVWGGGGGGGGLSLLLTSSKPGQKCQWHHRWSSVVIGIFNNIHINLSLNIMTVFPGIGIAIIRILWSWDPVRDWNNIRGMWLFRSRLYIDGLVQATRIANALEFRHSCTNTSIYILCSTVQSAKYEQCSHTHNKT